MRTIIISCTRRLFNKAKIKYTTTWTDSICTNMQQFLQRQELLIESMNNTISICAQIKEEQMNHIAAIEKKREENIS
jgi:hypothetical protein